MQNLHKPMFKMCQTHMLSGIAISYTVAENKLKNILCDIMVFIKLDGIRKLYSSITTLLLTGVLLSTTMYTKIKKE